METIRIRLITAYCLIGLIASAFGATVADAGTPPAAAIEHAHAAYQSCIARLPANIRLLFTERHRRARAKLSGADRAAWSVCIARERDWTDAVAIERFRSDLHTLVPDPAAEHEALIIATTIVQTTRLESEKYRMVGSPLFNNFLIQIGVKKQGFCYHWTEALLKALPPLPFKYYERHWGGANVAKMTENNGVIITARGAPVASGIVYDAWRGAGTPWWRLVRDDHYPWMERYSEQEILTGHITFAESR